MGVWYRQGTVSVDNGSTTVTGTTTGWTNQVLPGDGISFDGGSKWYEVAAINSNTSITLATAFAETTIADGTYATDRRSPKWKDSGQAAYLASQLIASIAGAVILTDGAPSNSIGNDNWLAFDPDTGTSYFKADGAWSAGTSLQGPQGDTGATGATGAAGADGADGNDGWSPVFALASDGQRRVLQVSDWTGGEGTKPATGDFVGAAGLTSTIGDAVDVRGATGAAGANGTAQASVLDRDLTAPPGSPTTGDRYIVGAEATGAWASEDGHIAEWSGSAWTFDTPSNGWLVFVEDEDLLLAWKDTEWVVAGGGGASGDTVDFVEQSSTPATPSAGVITAYARDDRFFYYKTSDGSVYGLGRRRLTANLDLYVATTGDDVSGDGTMGAPFATGQKAFDTAGALDLGNYRVRVYFAAGTYAGFIKSGPWVGGPASGAPVEVIGDTANPGNVVISTTAENCVDISAGAYVSVSGLKLTTTSGSGLRATNGGAIVISGPMEYGACSWAHRNAGFGGRIIGSNQKCLISGSALFHFYTVVGGLQQAQVYSFMLANTPAFSQAFAHSIQGSVIYANASTTSITTNGTTTNGSAVVTGIATTAKICVGAPVSGTGIPGGTTVASVDSSTQLTLSANATASGTVSLKFGGSATGKRYTVASNGTIDVGGAGGAAMPGSIAGTNVDGTGAYG